MFTIKFHGPTNSNLDGRWSATSPTGKRVYHTHSDHDGDANANAQLVANKLAALVIDGDPVVCIAIVGGERFFQTVARLEIVLDTYRSETA